MKIVRVEAPGRPMVGMVHEPRRFSTGHCALLVNPFGQEATRTSTLYRALADELAARGIVALRFDLHGTGESLGDGEDQSLAAWVGDVRAAGRYLVERWRPSRISWIGMGLGATAALKAVAGARPQPDRLVLINPVVDGIRYVERLCAAHRRSLEMDFNMPWSFLHDAMGEPEPVVPGVVLGYPVPPALVGELHALKADVHAALARVAGRVVLVADGEDEEHLDAVLARSGVETRQVHSTVDWLSNEALGTALVPASLRDAVLEAVA